MENINVFTGPMKCGKSRNLIQEANKYISEGKIVKVFKPVIDDRFSNDEVVDRDGNRISAINIEKIEDIAKYDADAYFIDEFQFLDGNLESIKNLANNGKKFFIAGLNLTSEKKPFGHMNEILSCSDNVHMMTARCECCNNDNAIYSYCKAEKTGEILIGDSVYIPVCSNCYENLIKNKNF